VPDFFCERIFEWLKPGVNIDDNHLLQFMNLAKSSNPKIEFPLFLIGTYRLKKNIDAYNLVIESHGISEGLGSLLIENTDLL